MIRCAYKLDECLLPGPRHFRSARAWTLASTAGRARVRQKRGAEAPVPRPLPEARDPRAAAGMTRKISAHSDPQSRRGEPSARVGGSSRRTVHEAPRGRGRASVTAPPPALRLQERGLGAGGVAAPVAVRARLVLGEARAAAAAPGRARREEVDRVRRGVLEAVAALRHLHEPPLLVQVRPRAVEEVVQQGLVVALARFLESAWASAAS